MEDTEVLVQKFADLTGDFNSAIEALIRRYRKIPKLKSNVKLHGTDNEKVAFENQPVQWKRKENEGNEQSKSEIETKDSLGHSLIQSLGSHPVATNGLILDLIFQHLDLESLKSCRHVCKYWKDTSYSYFDQNTKVRFFWDTEPLTKYLESFKEDLTFPCGHVLFEGIDYLLSEFAQVLQGNAGKLHTLQLININLTENYRPLPIYNLFDLDISMGSHLRSLEISSHGSTQLVVPLKSIISIEDLNLSNCVVIMNNEVKISPKKLEFSFVQYENGDGKKMDSLNLNEFFDFENVKEIKINKTVKKPDINLDLEMCQNWINSVDVSYVDLSINKSIKLKCLKYGTVKQLDLACLPHSLEAFHFEKGKLINSAKSRERFLPNIKSFFWEIVIPPAVFPDFSTCTNLTDVTINVIIEYSGISNLNWLPSTVKRLKLGKNTSVDHVGDYKRHLESVCLMNYCWLTIPLVLNVFTCDHLTITLENPESMNSLAANVGILMDIVRNHEKSVIIGKFNWDTDEQFNEILSANVDKKSHYYCFENGKGKAMSDEDFHIHLISVGMKSNMSILFMC